MSNAYLPGKVRYGMSCVLLNGYVIQQTNIYRRDVPVGEKGLCASVKG